MNNSPNIAATASSHEEILAGAYEAANIAIQAEIARQPEDMNALDCGYAWVVVRPASSSFVRWCKSQIKEMGGERVVGSGHFGSAHHPTGWHFWCPGDFNGQSVRIMEVGARAFARSLTADGVPASFSSRLD